MNDFTLIIDNREQKPVLWDKEGDPAYPGMKVTWGTLPTGDYSIKGMHAPDCKHSICIERKSLEDLFGSCGWDRKRFEREIIRMKDYDSAMIVIEADLRTIIRNPPPVTQMNPKSVYRSLLAFCLRYGISIWPCPNRRFAERHIYLSLKRFWDDRQPGKISNRLE